jgi:hypothetical protein
MKKLAIAIPTYNEFNYLKVGLSSLIEQVDVYKNEVDLYVFDNNSNDKTGIEVPKLFNKRKNCHYIKNSKNVGLYLNQLKSLQIDNYQYNMVVGSDDVILPESISIILKYLAKEDCSIFFTNYYAFSNNYMEPQQFFVEEKDKSFSRPYDMLNYPSVGHFSGFIFRSIYTKKYLDILLMEHDTSFYEQHRGIIGFLAAYICSKENKKTFFIGKRCLATKAYKKVNYNHLTHCCSENLNNHYNFFKKDISNYDDYLYRKNLIRQDILKSSIRNLPFMTKHENYETYQDLRFHYKDEVYFNMIIAPIFYINRINLLRKFFVYLINFYIKRKKV